MPYCPRVCIPSFQGTYERILSSQAFGDQGIAGDNARVAQLLTVSWTALLADSPIDSRKPNRVINRFLTKLTNDLFGTIAVFSRLAHELTVAVSVDVGENVIIIGDFLVEMKDTPVFREYLHFHKTRDPQALRYLLSFLQFGKKLFFESQDLETNALRGWLEVEDRLKGLELPPFVRNLKVIMTWIFDQWSIGPFLPKHGGGAVAERGVRGIEAKNVAFGRSPKIDLMYNRGSILDYPVDWTSEPNPSVKALTKSKAVSRLKFVPKDWKKKRSICMEPILFQWAQQGVRLWYEDYLSRSVLKEHVFIKDQGMNQLASQFGSLTNRVDTIDLSSASDSVAYELVKKIYPAKVLKHLIATRTSTVELPDGSELDVLKYAPMGSALCFPVQSTIYSAIILMVGMASRFGLDWKVPGIFDGVDLDQAYDLSFGRRLIDEDAHKYQPFYVYGDDMICDKRITSNVIDALTALAFQVNVEKSYVDSACYRESCGKHHFIGQDVTPMTFKVKKVGPRISIESLAGVLQMANRAREYGYDALRRHLIQFALHYPIQGVQSVNKLNPILFSSDPDDSFAILCDTPRNTHLLLREYDPDRAELRRYNFWLACKDPSARRWDEESNTQYQRDEVRSITPEPTSKVRQSSKFDNYRLGVWWRSRYRPAKTAPDEGVAVPTTDTLGVGVRWRWTAA